MTDNVTFSNDLQNTQAIDAALADIEQAVVRFEGILSRHARSLNAISGISGRRTSTGRLIAGSLARLGGLLSGRDLPDSRTVFNPTLEKTNRFPASSGQFMADLASAIQRIGGRNL
ncbi:MAG: hypothetical protein SFX19_03865 [Alphaproteobacteria bacterium]|nr:hypothetical protein [Alphaproteobacteria bacterium]